MKKLILITILLSLTGCKTVEKVLYTNSGVDDPTTVDVDESVELNPVVKGAINVTKPIAESVPFGGLAYGLFSTMLAAGLEVKRRKAKTAVKVAAIAIEKIAESDEGKELAKAVKDKVSKLASKHNVSKEIDRVVKEIS
jgi:hypothetical protein